jgi:hypothetical protein
VGNHDAAYDPVLAELLKELLETPNPVEAIGSIYTVQTDCKYIGRSQRQVWIRPMKEAVDEGRTPERLAEMGIEDTWYLRLTPVRLTGHYPLVFFQGTLSGMRGFGILDETGLTPLGFIDMELLSIDQLARDGNATRRAFVIQFIREILSAIR